jgi:cathepsin L
LTCVYGRPKWNELEVYSFVDYVNDFSREYSYKESIDRQRIFEKNLNEIKTHNNDPSFTWKMGVNHFTDQTDEEFKLLLGLNKPLLYLQKQLYNGPIYKSLSSFAPPASVDWRDKGIISAVKDQGECGSCWTFGTAETIESYSALKKGPGFIMDLSEQQILDCTPNPNDCGGTGGCNGGTAQLAMDRIVAMGGITTEWQYPYTSYFGNAEGCKFFSNRTQNPLVQLSSWVRLPENDQDAVIQALASVGPLIINVDASTWSRYETGIFNGCNQTNPDINHVVELVGYGEGFWIVRNSWNVGWGEMGYIRLNKDTMAPCGTDLNPQDGDICNGGPKTVEVCGTCGVVYDSTYPVLK